VLAFGRRGLGSKLRKGVAVIGGARNLDAVYDSFLDEWYGQASPLVAPVAWRGEERTLPAGTPPLAVMTYRDAISYLPDDILVKVDRAAMSVSLETRVPFLDHRVAALAARISPELKLRGGKGKHVLRRLLARHVPDELFERPKAGFGLPVGDWIAGPLRDWAEALLDPKRLREEGLLDVEAVRARWAAHLAGARNTTPAIWSILMLEAWREAR